jgi:hypothetical protein
VNVSKLYHILGSNHSMFYLWSFQVLFPYKFLVLKMRTLLLTKYMWKTITFHCLPSSRCKVICWQWKEIDEIFVLKNQIASTCFGASSTHIDKNLKNTLKLDFSDYSKVFKLNSFIFLRGYEWKYNGKWAPYSGWF